MFPFVYIYYFFFSQSDTRTICSNVRLIQLLSQSNVFFSSCFTYLQFFFRVFHIHSSIYRTYSQYLWHVHKDHHCTPSHSFRIFQVGINAVVTIYTIEYMIAISLLNSVDVIENRFFSLYDRSLNQQQNLEGSQLWPYSNTDILARTLKQTNNLPDTHMDMNKSMKIIKDVDVQRMHQTHIRYGSVVQW